MSEKALVKKNGDGLVPRIETPEVRTMTAPRTDVVETKEAIVLTVDVPGVDEKGVELSLHDGLLTVHASPVVTQVPDEQLPAWGAVLPAGYHRDFQLAAEVRTEDVEATVRDGVLRIVLPKAQTYRKIEVRTE